MTSRAPTDVLGAPYTAESIPLRPDSEGEVVATLVRRKAPGRSGRAVLHLHGFADYFFQTGYADWWVARGYDFYALDLRKYGRSLRPHQTPNFITDLRDYHEELDAAWERVTTRDRHQHVVLSGHSTGGLTGPLWADERRVDLAGLVLNAPWFDLAGSALMRTAGTQLIRRIGSFQPKREIPRTVTGLYARSLHSDFDGEWSFDLDWKPIASWPVYAGWLGAVREGHARLHAGLELTAPALVLTSASSASPATMGDDVHTTDIVLDVEQIRRWSPSVGRHVTYVSVPGARHDVFLSRAAARGRAYEELGRWATAYLTLPPR